MGDLISREAVLDKFADYVGGGMSMNDFDALWNIVEKMPSVENKGEWIHPYRSDIACECSVCHIQIPITDYFHYCPNCGADMRGEI